MVSVGNKNDFVFTVEKSTCAYWRARRGRMTSRDPVEAQMLQQQQQQHAAFLTSPQTFLLNVVATCAVAVSPVGRQLESRRKGKRSESTVRESMWRSKD